MFMRNIQYQVTLKIKHSGITARINPLIQGIEDNKLQDKHNASFFSNMSWRELAQSVYKVSEFY